jgi:hypothetical protein
MDPISLIAIGVTAVVCSVAGVGIGSWRERRTSPTIRDYQELESEHERAKRDLEYGEKHEGNLEEIIERVKTQRDNYRRMAETHDIKMPDPAEDTVQTGELWEGRRYCGHPEANLRNLTAELKAAGVWNKEVHIRLEILGSEMGGGTGFSTAIKKSWKRNGEPTKDIGPWVFHGTGKRAIADMLTFLMDDDTGLTKKNPKSKNRKMWIDSDSPLVFKIDAAVTEVIEAPKVPEVQIVEVAVVEERLVERIIEKEVFISIPAGREPELCGHTSEEIRSMVDDALARKVADAEVEQLEGLTKAPESRVELRRRMDAQRRAKASKIAGG